MEQRQLIRRLQAEMRRTTGRDYRIDFAALSVESLRELQRFVRDVESEKRSAVNRARLTPWRG
jgi:hypothetical protein